MGKCKHCGLDAGFFRWRHAECENKFQEGKRKEIEERKIADRRLHEGIQKITNYSQLAITNRSDLISLSAEISSLVLANNIPNEAKETALIKAWENAVDLFLEDSILTDEEEEKLINFMETFQLSNEMLNKRGFYTKVVKAGILRDLVNGKLPQRVSIEGQLPFNLQKNEKIVWLFSGTKYYEQKTRREYVGRSAGISIRIAKGVYYRTGAFRGHPVETSETVYIGNGVLGITNKYMYYTCSQKSFRIAHNKIVSIQPHSEGVTVHRDAATAKPQSFLTGDGWFTYNLLSNLTQF